MHRDKHRLSTTGLAHAPALFSKIGGKPARSATCILLVLLVAASSGFAQCAGCGDLGAAKALGAHNDGGRGCVSCHASHIALSFPDQRVSEQTISAPSSPTEATGALWGKSSNPPYGSKMLFGDTENAVEVATARVASPSEDVTGILLCISCHDGNLTPQNMMSNQSYAREMGFLRNPDRSPIPSLLADESARYSSPDHPLGPDATIPLIGGLAFTNGTFSVIPGSPYAHFMANYGLPVLAPGKRFVPYGGVNQAGQPYLLCTTCHNQHLMSSYTENVIGPNGVPDVRAYTSYHFANGPYNPEFDSAPTPRASSTAQFCRQCHFDLANEGNNTTNIRTAFY